MATPIQHLCLSKERNLLCYWNPVQDSEIPVVNLSPLSLACGSTPVRPVAVVSGSYSHRLIPIKSEMPLSNLPSLLHLPHCWIWVLVKVILRVVSWGEVALQLHSQRTGRVVGLGEDKTGNEETQSQPCWGWWHDLPGPVSPLEEWESWTMSRFLDFSQH